MVGGRPLWIPPRQPADVLGLRDHRGSGLTYDAAPDSLEACMALLGRHTSMLPAGSFVFVLSDFIDTVPARAWARLRGLRLDVTPVVIQDPTWEQSFPELDGVVLPIVDPSTGEASDVWLSGRDARRRARENEDRHSRLLDRFARLGFDPVLLESSEPDEIAARFRRWSDRRRRLRRQSA
jgi:hypothetical protein